MPQASTEVIDEAGFMASTPRQAITTIELNPRLALVADIRGDPGRAPLSAVNGEQLFDPHRELLAAGMLW